MWKVSDNLARKVRRAGTGLTSKNSFLVTYAAFTSCSFLLEALFFGFGLLDGLKVAAYHMDHWSTVTAIT